MSDVEVEADRAALEQANASMREAVIAGAVDYFLLMSFKEFRGRELLDLPADQERYPPSALRGSIIAMMSAEFAAKYTERIEKNLAATGMGAAMMTDLRRMSGERPDLILVKAMVRVYQFLNVAEFEGMKL